MYSMKKSPNRSRADRSNTSSNRNLTGNISNQSSHRSIGQNSNDVNTILNFSQEETKLHKAEYKKFCNKVEIMTKKGFLEYFRLEDLDGTLLADRLYASFSPSGSINFQKFIRGIGLLANGTFEDRVQLIFSLFDLKKNSVIEKSDMKKVLLSLLNVMLEIDVDREDMANLQDDVRQMTPQEREEAIEIILQGYGSIITYEEFLNHVISDPIIKQTLE